MKRTLFVLALLFTESASAEEAILLWKLDESSDAPRIAKNEWPEARPFPLRVISQWRKRFEGRSTWQEARLITVGDDGRSAVVATPWLTIGLLEATGERVISSAGTWVDTLNVDLVGRYESSVIPDRPWLASPDGRAALVTANRVSQLIHRARGVPSRGLGEVILAEQAEAAPRFAVLQANREGSFRERVVIYKWTGETTWSSGWYDGDHDYLYVDPTGSKVHFAGYEAGTYCYESGHDTPAIMEDVPPIPRSYSRDGNRMLAIDGARFKLLYFNTEDFCNPELLASRDTAKWFTLDGAISDKGDLVAVAQQYSESPWTRRVLLLDEALATVSVISTPGPVRFHKGYLVLGMLPQWSRQWIFAHGSKSVEVYDIADLTGGQSD
jgi:hypothetical protein